LATRHYTAASPEHATLPRVDSGTHIEEMDAHKIQQREKQIGYGKSTKGYANYIVAIPKEEREEDEEDHPMTPLATQQLSKRSWDGQLKLWRRQLHRWDDMENQPPADSIAPRSVSLAELSEEATTEERHPLTFFVEHSATGRVGEPFFPKSTFPTRSRTRGPNYHPSWASEASDATDYMNLTCPEE
jgi:hypothetical protein